MQSNEHAIKKALGKLQGLIIVSSATVAESATVRALPLLGSLQRIPPFICSMLSTMAICPVAKSTLRQRRAAISPHRKPQRTASTVGMNIGVLRMASSNSAVWATS